MFKRLSYSKKIFFILMGSSLLVALLSIGVSLYFVRSHSNDNFNSKLKSVTHLLAYSLSSKLSLEGIKNSQATILELADLAKLHQIVIWSADKALLYHYNPRNLVLPELENNEHFSSSGRHASFVQPIKDKKKLVGFLHVLSDTSQTHDEILQRLLYLGLFFSILIFLIYIFSRRMKKLVFGPISSLALTAAVIRDEQNFGIRVSTTQVSEEIVLLYETFNEMLSKIEQRERQRDMAEDEASKYRSHLELLAEDLENRVSRRTEDLQSSMQNLQEAQVQLLESEKMASLGNLVGGMAHEVNTPLGNAITSLSILSNTTKNLQDTLDLDTLTRSDLVKSLSVLLDTAHIIQTNVSRAADLIRSFKKVSIDQVLENSRSFQLKEYSHEILTTFKSHLKKAGVAFEIIMDKEISVISFPGLYAQIVSNLIQNSLMHAFTNVKDPKIILEIVLNGDEVELMFSDNGTGIDAAVKETLFEPFVTTKRNQGGSGLGLNIVYNLVKQKLKGSINVVSQPKQGSLFKIRFKVEI